MQKRLKIWVYKEGEPPLFHRGPMKEIYSIEGQFIDEMESGESPFLTNSPENATAFFLSISIAKAVKYVYNPRCSCGSRWLQNIFVDYVNVVSNKYPYWSRSNGADHFYVSCHDWVRLIYSSSTNTDCQFLLLPCPYIEVKLSKI